MNSSFAAARRSPTYLEKRRRARIALGACVVLLFLGYAYLSFLEAFLAPFLIPAGDRIFLLYEAAVPHEGDWSFYLRERAPGGEWQPERRFQGEVRGAVGANEDLWVFYRRTGSVYRGGKQVAAYDLGIPWDVQAVVPAADSAATDGARRFLVFGFDSDHILRAAELTGPRPGERRSELPGRPLAASPARAASPDRMQAARCGDSVLVAWTRDARAETPAPRADENAIPAEESGGPWSLQACRFDGERFHPVPPLPLGSTRTFSLFPLRSAAALLTVPEEWKDGPQVRLRLRRFPGTSWDEAVDLRVTDPRWFGRRVLDVSLCATEDQALLVLSRAAGLELTSTNLDPLARGESAQFPPPQPVSPVGSFGRPEVLAWLVTLLFVALAMVFLGVSLLTERIRPAVPPPGTPPVVTAPWWTRGLAYVLDACALAPVVLVVLWACGFSALGIERLDGGPLLLATLLTDLTIMTYAAVCEGLWGRTLGKRLLGLHVLTEEGGRIGWRHAILRNLVRPIDGVGPQCLIGLLFILSTRHAQRLGDILAGTVVSRQAPHWYA